MKCGLYSSFVLVAFALGIFGQGAAGSEVTAFSLIKKGDNYVPDSAKDKVVEIRSEKSSGGLVPNIWYVTYYAPTATIMETEVKFAGGKMIYAKRRMRLLEPVSGGSKTLDGTRFNVDSDAALANALKDPLLAGRHPQTTQFWLQQDGRNPAWKIRFWAANPADPGKMEELGDIFISAKNGKVVQKNLHP